ncbi:MAG TPA: TIGR03668 family PPOX class F420-dependent oxidoreductase [Jatrophihabitans sp.]|nr:TIGR03668 family PPOX class F420-dependent oxidoreductase [Jatrophihabitans sp.]
MRLDAAEARQRFASARVARLATASATARPHIVPIVFALAGNTLYFAVDAKPKSTTALRRLANIAENPHVSVLADRYEDDWTQLWWARADGVARLAESDEAGTAVRLLTKRYPTYAADPPPGPVVAVTVRRWSGWAAASSGVTSS